MSATTVLAVGEIHVGEHVTFSFLGMEFNADTIWSTTIAGLIVIGLGLWMRRKITSGVPSKIQLIWEGLVKAITGQVESSLGRVHPYVVPLAVALFTFILIANWLELIPSGEDPHLLPAPTADVNLTYVLGLLVIISMHVYSIRRRGLRAYVAHYFQPYAVLFPLNLIEEIVKPFTLALRLFGNIFAGGIMISLIGLFPVWLLWGPNGLWKMFDMFIGVMQAFIFALLTIIYFGLGGETHDEAGPEHRAEPASGAEPAAVPAGSGARQGAAVGG